MQASFLSLELSQQPLCVDLCPTAPLLATGLIDGTLVLHTYAFQNTVAPQEPATKPTPAAGGSKGGHKGKKQQSKAEASAAANHSDPSSITSSSCKVAASLAHTIAAHGASAAAGGGDGDNEDEHSCRAVAFLTDGSALVSGSSDHSLALFDSRTAGLVRRLPGAHDAGITALYCPAPGLLASGDEDGMLKLWDIRAKKAAMHYKKHSDFISGFALHAKDQCLVASSGDGTLSVHDLRTCRIKMRTEDDADDEVLSVAVVKNGRKLVAGTQSGVLNIYTWGAMRDCSDRFPGHPESVDAVVTWDEDTILTGSSDGVVRVVGVLPNKLLGIVGEHSELPVERLALAADRRVLASASHDQTVKLWDMSFLLDDDDDDGEEEEEGEGEQDEEGEGTAGGLSMGLGVRLRPGSEEGEEEEEGGEGEAEEDGSEEELGSSGSDAEEGEGEEEVGVSGGESESGSDDEAVAAALQSNTKRGKQQQQQGQKEQKQRIEKQGGAKTGGEADEEVGTSGRGLQAAAGSSGGKKLPAKLQKQREEESDDGDSDAGDSDDSDGPQKKKRKKAEKTRWRQESKEQAKRKQVAANFFADLL